MSRAVLGVKFCELEGSAREVSWSVVGSVGWVWGVGVGERHVVPLGHTVAALSRILLNQSPSLFPHLPLPNLPLPFPSVNQCHCQSSLSNLSQITLGFRYFGEGVLGGILLTCAERRPAWVGIWGAMESLWGKKSTC